MGKYLGLADGTTWYEMIFFGHEASWVMLKNVRDCQMPRAVVALCSVMVLGTL